MEQRRPGAPAGVPQPPRLLSAFGETKRLTAWAADPRCAVGYHTLYHRAVLSGWPILEALTIPAKPSREQLLRLWQLADPGRVAAERAEQMQRELAERERRQQQATQLHLICRACGVGFETLRRHQQYCSSTCSKRAYYERAKRDPAWRERKKVIRQQVRRRRRAKAHAAQLDPGALPEWLTEQQLARYLGVPVATVRDWRSRGAGPKWVQTQEQIIWYGRPAVLLWQRRRMVRP